jgi:hypothetical protein
MLSTSRRLSKTSMLSDLFGVSLFVGELVEDPLLRGLSCWLVGT